MLQVLKVNGEPTNSVIDTERGTITTYTGDVTVKACGCKFRWVWEALEHVH